MTATAETKFQKLQQPEIVLLTKLVMRNARIDELNRIVIFSEGWSDHRLLQELHKTPGREKLSLDAVIDFRKANFGMLETEASRAKKSAVDEADLRRMVMTLQLRVEALERQVNQ